MILRELRRGDAHSFGELEGCVPRKLSTVSHAWRRHQCCASEGTCLYSTQIFLFSAKRQVARTDPRAMGCQVSRAVTEDESTVSRNFQIIAQDALTASHTGHVRCILPAHRLPQKSVLWIERHAGVTAQEGGLEADLPPGDYLVQVVDSLGEYTELRATVGEHRCPIVVEYESTPCSSASSRDGVVTARVERAPRGCRFLWTSGVTTTEPVLRNATAGCYAATLLDAHGRALLFVHACDVCRLSVDPARLG